MPKRDLTLTKPLLNAAGTLGTAPDFRAQVAWEKFGAFITNPISMRPRLPTRRPAAIDYAGGVLLHTGLPNPGFHTVTHDRARAWAQSTLPIIVHLIADRPDETREMVRTLENMDNVLAAELGFAPLLADDLVVLAAEMSMGELPLIASLPVDQLLRVGPRLLALGVQALAIAAPRGAIEVDNVMLSGRLLGPSLLPLAMELVGAASRLGLPIIASCGIYSDADAQAALRAGATAVELDAALWLPTGKEKGLV